MQFHFHILVLLLITLISCKSEQEQYIEEVTENAQDLFKKHKRESPIYLDSYPYQIDSVIDLKFDSLINYYNFYLSEFEVCHLRDNMNYWDPEGNYHKATHQPKYDVYTVYLTFVDSLNLNERWAVDVDTFFNIINSFNENEN